MSKYNFGDKVRVREDLKVGNKYGNDVFMDEMEWSKGEVVSIREVCENGKYRIYGSTYYWTDEMFETADVLAENTIPDSDTVILLLESYLLELVKKRNALDFQTNYSEVKAITKLIDKVIKELRMMYNLPY